MRFGHDQAARGREQSPGRPEGQFSAGFDPEDLLEDLEPFLPPAQDCQGVPKGFASG